MPGPHSRPHLRPHPPKTEIFNTETSINTDPKGFLRPVDTWGTAVGMINTATDASSPCLDSTALPGAETPAPTALYMARPADHPRFGYLESWLLPALDLRVNRFHFRNGSTHGHYPDQDLYIDVCRIDPPDSPDGRIWRTTDLYIDIVTYARERWEVLDLEELGDALVEGFLDAKTAHRALAAAQRAITGIVTTGSAHAFLQQQGYDLHWADPAEVTLAPAQGQDQPEP